jgi:CubicO group peptidase (beta-lactamase class C family)
MTPFGRDAAAAARAALEAAVPQHGPGLALGVLRDGAVTAALMAGRADVGNAIDVTPHTVFHIASLSKQFTAAAVTLLELDGRVDVDAPITAWIPELHRMDDVTVTDLLHHQSGIADQWELAVLSGRRYPSDVVTTADVLGVIARLPGPAWRPGTRTEYANSNFTLLSLIAERAAGMSFAAFCATRLWRPLGLEHTWVRDHAGLSVPAMARGYDQRPGVPVTFDEPGFAVPGASGLLTCLTDLLAWEASAMDPASPLAAMHARLLIPGRFRDGRPSDFARGLVHGNLAGHETVGHSGADGGFRAELLRVPATRLTVVALANGSAMHPARAAKRVVVALLGGGDVAAGAADRDATPAAATPAVPAIRARRAEDLAGTYVGRDHGVLLTLTADGETLRMHAWGGDMDLVPDGAGGHRSATLDAPIVLLGDRTTPDGLRIAWPDGGRDFQRHVPHPDAAAIADSAEGTYVSTVLQVVWELRAADGALVLSRPGGNERRVIVHDAHRLVSADLGWIGLVRDATGRVSGLDIGQGIVLNRYP